jgi:hypothetical protein
LETDSVSETESVWPVPRLTRLERAWSASATGTAATVIVEYAGTRHHVPLTTGVWQPITLYNPDERTLYVLFQPPQPPPN